MLVFLYDLHGDQALLCAIFANLKKVAARQVARGHVTCCIAPATYLATPFQHKSQAKLHRVTTVALNRNEMWNFILQNNLFTLDIVSIHRNRP